MSTLMVSISGVRGIIGEGLTPEVVMNFAMAYGTFAKNGKVVVGRDPRVSGEMVKNAVVAGLLSVGCDIIDIGICPTPTTQIAVEKLHAAGGIMITASHNPIMWNGLKLLDSSGLFLDAEQGEQVIEISKTKNYSFKSWDKIGKLTKYENAVQDHFQEILKLEYLDIEKIRARKFKVVLDCICGAGSVIIPQLLEHLGCEVIKLNCEPTGLFPRNPEPLPENLAEVCEAVKANNAEIGFVVDPDSDRLALVSDKGEPMGEEKTLALVVKHFLTKKSGTVVINASTSRITEDVAREAGSEVIRTKVGEINVAKKMLEINAAIGGEGNGGIILPDVHLGRDAPIGVALTLQHLTEFGGSISELDATLPKYVITKDKIALDNIDPKQALQKINDLYAHENLDFTDGIKILRDRSWIHIRASNTEPIIRVIAEAPTAEESKRLCAEIKGKFQLA